MKWLFVLLALIAATPVAAQSDLPAAEWAYVQLPDPEMEAEARALMLELRCLVCQNQNLADSDAPLAQQLRGEIFDMLQDGRSDEEITGFMVDRYGDFVLYRPPMQGNTLALWVMPLAILLIGAVGVGFTVRNRSRKLAAARQKETT